MFDECHFRLNTKYYTEPDHFKEDNNLIIEPRHVISNNVAF